MRELTRLSPGKAPAKDFRQWLVANFGRSISRSYLIPLNEKMWVYPLEKMSAEWMARRVSCMDLKEIKSKLKSGTQAGTGWGPNSTFIYPASGGIGEVFRRASSGFGSRLVLGCRAVKIDLRSRTVFFADGKRQAFDALINTSSLKEFVPMLYPLNPRLVKSVKRLRHNRLLVIGVGLKKKGKDKRNWLYFPERSYPFFRVTNLSNYSSYNLPEGKSESYSSLLAEMAFSEKAPLKIKRRPLIEATIKHLVYGGLMCEADRSRIESIFCLQAEQAYPIPTLDREEALLEIEGYLEKNSILSRGRFGSFRYEQGNMDDCFTQGFTAARRIVER